MNKKVLRLNSSEQSNVSVNLSVHDWRLIVTCLEQAEAFYENGNFTNDESHRCYRLQDMIASAIGMSVADAYIAEE